MNTLKHTTTNKALSADTKLITLALPIGIEVLLGVLLNNVDTIMISNYSDNLVGAVGNANLIFNLMYVLFSIIGTATAVVVSQYLGAELKDRINTVYSVAFIINIAFGIALSAGLFFGAEFLMSLLGVPDVMIDDAVTYVQIVGGTIFLQSGFVVMNSIMRCNGLQRFGMISAMSVNVLNIIGNWLFLFGPLKVLNLGVAGVSISTAFARLVQLIILIVVFYGYKLGHLSVKYLFPFPKKIFYTMLKIGLPSAGESVSYDMYQIILLSLVNGMGVDSINARVYCSVLLTISGCFGNCVANASQVIVGYLVGAGLNDEADRRVKKYLWISVPMAIGIASLNWLLSPYTLRLFTDSSGAIEIARNVLIVCILLEAGRSMNMIVINSMKAAGYVRFPFLVGLCTMWIIGLGFGSLAGVGLGWGVVGIFLGTALDEFVRGIIVTIRWYSQKWRGKAIAQKKPNEVEA